MRGQSLRRALARAREERGIALPAVLIIITIGFALATVGVMAAMGSISNAGRDTSDKSAFGVAEAGAKQALLRQNKILTNPANGSYNCLVEGSGGTLIASSPQGDGWCAAQTGEINGGTYSYRILPAGAIDPETGTRLVKIVAEGTLNGETRRIQLSAETATGTPAFSGGQVIGLNKFYMEGNASIDGSVKTNADLRLQGNAEVCGDVSVGTGKQVIADHNAGVECGGTVTQGTTVLGPVDPGDVRTNNSNLRLQPNGGDTRTGNSNQVQWNASTRRLKLEANATITLGGTNYDLCSLQLTGNSQLIIADGAQVRLYFDSPENCGLGNGAKQVETQGNTKIIVTSEDPNDLAILLTGSDTLTTYVWLQGNSSFTNYATVYAPRSNIRLEGNADFVGAIAGKEMYIQGNGEIIGVDSTLNFTTPVETVYKPTRFVECTATPMSQLGSDPSAGC